jgi:hypothetical protein
MPAEALMEDSNPEIHSPYDTLDVSNNSAAHAVKFARLGAAFVVELAKGAPAPPDNMVPVLSIVAPAGGSHAADVELVGMADDPEDGDLAATIHWSSSKDGDLGIGATRRVTLSAGTHEIVATVTDSANAMASASMSLTVRSGDGGDDDGPAHGGCSTSDGAALGVGLVLLARRRRRQRAAR